MYCSWICSKCILLIQLQVTKTLIEQLPSPLASPFASQVFAIASNSFTLASFEFFLLLLIFLSSHYTYNLCLVSLCTFLQVWVHETQLGLFKNIIISCFFPVDQTPRVSSWPSACAPAVCCMGLRGSGSQPIVENSQNLASSRQSLVACWLSSHRNTGLPHWCG